MIKNKNSRRPRTLAGFTLLEMIVVIAIIGVLASIIVPSTVSSIRDSKIETANTMAYEYYTAVQNYLTDVQIKNLPLCGDDSVKDKVFPVSRPADGKLLLAAKVTASGSVVANDSGVTTFRSLSVDPESKKSKLVQKFINGVNKYIGTNEVTKNTIYWTAQIDVDTYTVDWVVYCDDANAANSLKTLMNNYSGDHLYMTVFGKSTGTNTSQEYDAMHTGSENTPAYVGQYPIPYEN